MFLPFDRVSELRVPAMSSHIYYESILILKRIRRSGHSQIWGRFSAKTQPNIHQEIIITVTEGLAPYSDDGTSADDSRLLAGESIQADKRPSSQWKSSNL